MQKIATKVFIAASIVFGIIGFLVVWTLPINGDGDASNFHFLLMKIMFATAFVILSSFALSVAGKYLNK